MCDCVGSVCRHESHDCNCNWIVLAFAAFRRLKFAVYELHCVSIENLRDAWLGVFSDRLRWLLVAVDFSLLTLRNPSLKGFPIFGKKFTSWSKLRSKLMATHSSSSVHYKQQHAQLHAVLSSFRSILSYKAPCKVCKLIPVSIRIQCFMNRL